MTIDDVQSALRAEEVDSLVKKDAVVESTDVGFILRHFLIPKKGHQEWRPIISLRPLNQNLRYRHFKMEGVVTVR